MDVKILLFYKFVPIENTEKFASEHLRFCKILGVFGKILIANEGINGSVSGTSEQTERYKEELRKDERFSDIVFKEESGLTHPFKKMFVRIKKEIIRFDRPVDLSKKGRYISPKEFLQLYENKDNEEIIILDTRNDYESRVGKFRGAVTPKIENFRDFPSVVEELADKKNVKIVTYCTGGIRCEKASAYLVEQGFTNVWQLEGGIITFVQQFPNTVWEGKCFVFDKRTMSDLNSDGRPITNCDGCSIECDLFRNCTNLKCNARIMLCIPCVERLQGCCSQKCFLEHIRTQVPVMKN